jgi:hypothetical protein
MASDLRPGEPSAADDVAANSGGRDGNPTQRDDLPPNDATDSHPTDNLAPRASASISCSPDRDSASVRAAADRLLAHAARACPARERTIQALLSAARLLIDPQQPLAQSLRRELEASTGLHRASIEWGLSTTLASVQPGVLRALTLQLGADAQPAQQPNGQYSELESPQPSAAGLHPYRLISVVLAGNVFSAAVRALFLPLLAEAHVLAKASSHDAALSLHLKAALDAADPEIGRRLEVVRFARDDHAAGTALCERADVLSVYGDDASVAALRRLAPPHCTVLAHGHGLSAAYVALEQLADPTRAAATASELALDVAAYDQTGCLSPHFALVQSGGPVSPRQFARLLAVALEQLAERLPLGAAGPAERAAALQWRAVASVRGELFQGNAHAVSYEGAHPPRPSPGGRQIGVYDCADTAALLAALRPFGEHLKCLGIAGAPSLRDQLAQARGTFGLCACGQMQNPGFDDDADGRPPMAGLHPAL